MIEYRFVYIYRGGGNACSMLADDSADIPASFDSAKKSTMPTATADIALASGKIPGAVTDERHRTVPKTGADKFPELQGKTRELSKIFMDEIPVLDVSDEVESQFLMIVEAAQKNISKEKLLEIDKAIFDLYQLTEEERNYIGFIDFGDMQSLAQ